MLAAGLRRAGHDAVHLVEYDMLRSDDVDVLIRARDEERTVVSADSDFAMLLATQKGTRPSFVLFRHRTGSPASQLEQLIARLPSITKALEEGSIVVFEESRIRVRKLPIDDEEA